MLVGFSQSFEGLNEPKTDPFPNKRESSSRWPQNKDVGSS
jgi:hypothetical protein